MLSDSKRRRVGDQPATTLSFKDDDSLEDSVGENDEEEDNFDYFTIQEEPRRKTPKGPTSKLLNSAKSTDPSVKSDGHLTEEQNVKIAAEYKQILSLCGDGVSCFLFIYWICGSHLFCTDEQIQSKQDMEIQIHSCDGSTVLG